MSGRRRTGAGLKAFADTLVPIEVEKRQHNRNRAESLMDAELKRKYDLEDFYKEMHKAGILKGIGMGTIHPVTFEPQVAPSKKPKSALDIENDLVNRLQDTDQEVVKKATEELGKRKEVRSGLKAETSTEKLARMKFESQALREQADAAEIARKKKRGFLGNTKDLFLGMGDAEAAPVGLGQQPQTGLGPQPAVHPGMNIPEIIKAYQDSLANPGGVSVPGSSKASAKQAQIDQALKEAKEAMDAGVDPQEVKKRVEAYLGGL